MAGISYAIIDPVGTIALENFDIQPGLPANTSIKEINIVESITSPVTQVIAIIHSDIYNPIGKDFDKYKNQLMQFTLKGISGAYEGASYRVEQKTYRLDNRERVQNNFSNVEEMSFHAIDETVLTDAKTLVSKSWKCTKPSEVVKNVLQNCLKAENPIVDSADPARDYIAENIHPFQVINQQANVGLDGGDPSFLHFMTIDADTGKGIHHFQSLKKLTGEKSVETFKFGEPTVAGYKQSGNTAINFSFPCDYDYLSDLLNGVDEQGQNQNSIATADQVWKQFQKLIGSGSQKKSDCGIGQYNYKMAQSNKSTAENRNSCNLDVENHLLKRQARMGLLEKDKIALRITVPWNPKIHAGSVITFQWKNKIDGNTDVYGHGDYLVSSLVHNIRMGGYATTTMDCVATSVGQGIV